MAAKKVKKDRINIQGEDIETCLKKNNSKRAYQLVKDLNLEQQHCRSTIIQKKSGKCLTEDQQVDRILLRIVQPWELW